MSTGNPDQTNNVHTVFCPWAVIPQAWGTIECKNHCATPGAEPRHETFFYFFTVVFEKGALLSRHHQNSLEGFAALLQSTFCWKAGDTFWEHSQLNRDCCQAEKNVAWCEILRKRPCKRTRTQNLRKWSEFFLAFSNPYFCGKEGILFCKCFSQKISHWPSNFFGYPQPLGVCAIVPGDCNHSNGTAEPARWRRRKPLHCQRRRFRFDAAPARCTLCWHVEHAKFRNFEMEKWIVFRFFSFCDFGGTKTNQAGKYEKNATRDGLGWTPCLKKVTLTELGAENLLGFPNPKIDFPRRSSSSSSSSSY